MKNMWILIGIVSALSSAIVVVCDKLGTRYIDSTVLGIIQTSAVFLMLVGMQFYVNPFTNLASIDMSVMPYVLASSVFTAISYVCYYLIIGYTSVSSAASMNQLSIVFTIYLAMMFLGDAVTWQSILGSFFMVMGMGCMVRKC